MSDDPGRTNAPDPAESTPPAPPPAEAAPPAPAPITPAPAATGSTGIPTWELLVMGAGALALIGSFLPFYSIDSSEFGGRVPDVSWSAWSNLVNLFPISTLAVLLIVAAGAHVALNRFTQTSLPDRIMGFDWSDLRLLFGGLATLTMVAYLLRSFDGDASKGIGLFLVLIAAIGLVVAAVMERQTRVEASAADLPPSPATPGDWVVMGAGVALVIGSFLAVYSGRGESINAWEAPLFPLYLIPAILGLAMAAQIAVTTLASRGVPARIMGLETTSLHRIFALYAALVMIGFLIGDPGFDFVRDPDKGAGFWIMLIAALGLVAGTYMRENPQSTATTP